MFFKFPIIPIAPYLTISLANLPTMVSTFIYNKKIGFIVAVGINLLYWMLKGFNILEGVGILSSLIFSITMLSTLFFKKKIHLFLSIMITCIITTLLDYLIIFPIYINIFNFKFRFSLLKIIITAIIPFNIIKSLIIGTISIFIIKNLNIIK